MAITALLFCLALVLYRYRKSETAGSALAFVRLEGIIKILIAVPVAARRCNSDSQYDPVGFVGAGCDSGIRHVGLLPDGIYLSLGYSPDIDA